MDYERNEILDTIFQLHQDKKVFFFNFFYFYFYFYFFKKKKNQNYCNVRIVISSLIQTRTKKEQENKKEKPKENTIIECTICMENQVDSIFIPCNHIVCCFVCANTWFQQNNKCPTCRTIIIQINKAYF